MAGWLYGRPAIMDSGAPLDEDPVMQILVGQGNPDPKYQRNRHNLGFMLVDAIATEYGFGPWRSKFQSQVCEGRVGGEKVLLMKPETYYNETGRAAQAAIKFYKLGAEDVTVFHDEIDLAPGRMRMKRGGGHSGNNGIRSMMAHVGADIRRVRLGVGHPGDKSRVMPFVLSDFSKADEVWRDALIAACCKALPLLFEQGDERFQTEVMRLAPAPKSDPKQAR
jgi:peptidyl-tRNA hydrolase, PTH1 family